MKKQFLIQKVVLSVSLIVLSVAVQVNYRLAGGVGWENGPVADGVPLRPPIQPPPPRTPERGRCSDPGQSASASSHPADSQTWNRSDGRRSPAAAAD
jgi:hypothetical protein